MVDGQSLIAAQALALSQVSFKVCSAYRNLTYMNAFMLNAMISKEEGNARRSGEVLGNGIGILAYMNPPMQSIYLPTLVG